MERLIFCPLKNDHLTFEIQRRKQDPDASIVSDADKSDTVKPTYPIVADTSKWFFSLDEIRIPVFKILTQNFPAWKKLKFGT